MQGVNLGKTINMGKENAFIHAITDGFRRWDISDGCTTRSEYWYFLLFGFLVLLLCSILKIAEVWAFIFFFPSTFATIRRLHDSNHSGWNYLWHFLPLIGEVRLLYLCCLPSKRDFSNQYWKDWCQYEIINRSF